VSTRSPNEQFARIHGDDLNLPPRLVSLVNEVLREMEMPAEGSSDVDLLLALSRAFSVRARDPSERRLRPRSQLNGSR
jgi:hypothetical protein